MEPDEMQISSEELRDYIRSKVASMRLLPPDLEQRYKALRSLLERRQKMASDLLRLQRSVSACEAIVRKQYSFLGWEYRDTDSDDDDGGSSGRGQIRPSPCEPVRPVPQDCLSAPANGHTTRSRTRRKDQAREKSKEFPGGRGAVKRLNEWTSRPPQSSASEDDDFVPPETESSDPDFEICHSASKRRKKTPRRHERAGKRDAESNGVKTSEPEVKKDGGVEVNARKESTSGANTKATDPSLNVCRPRSAAPVDLSVNMAVVARRRDTTWQHGEIVKILAGEGGKLKYRIRFEDGERTVSAHHVASDDVPTLQNLIVGARVVIKQKLNKQVFRAGILAEIPCRSNHSRFMVFLDDHTPTYISLSCIRLVCRPLENPLDEITDSAHRKFMEEYLKTFPYPCMNYYMIGPTNVLRKGVVEKCQVVKVDCSLINVVYQDGYSEWIYRGSMRLEEVMNLRKQMESQKKKKGKITSSRGK